MVLGFVISMFFLNSFVPGIHLDLGEYNILLTFVASFAAVCMGSLSSLFSDDEWTFHTVWHHKQTSDCEGSGKWGELYWTQCPVWLQIVFPPSNLLYWDGCEQPSVKGGLSVWLASLLGGRESITEGQSICSPQCWKGCRIGTFMSIMFDIHILKWFLEEPKSHISKSNFVFHTAWHYKQTSDCEGPRKLGEPTEISVLSGYKWFPHSVSFFSTVSLWSSLIVSSFSLVVSNCPSPVLCQGPPVPRREMAPSGWNS